MRHYENAGLKGSITLESALIMPIVIIIIVSIIKFGYGLHDRTIISMLDKYETVKARMIEWSFYNVEVKGVDLSQLVNKPLIDITGEYKKYQDAILDKLISEYESKLILGGKYTQAVMNHNNGIKNSTIVRATHILLDHAGRIKYD